MGLKRVVTLLILGLSQTVQAGELRLLEADYVGLEGSQIDSYRNPYMPDYTTGSGGEEWRYGAAALFDICILCYDDLRLFWNNRAYTYGTDRQVRHVGWYWEAGINIWPDKITVFHRHHSEHCMECEGPAKGRGFPLLDEYVVRFDLYRRK